MIRRLILADPLRICGQGSPIAEIHFIELIRAEVDPKDAALLSNTERFSKKDSSNQLGNVPENDLHA